MDTNFSKHNKKAKKYRQQIEKIQFKYPEIDLKSKELLRDINKLHLLLNKLIIEETDAKECKSGNINDICSDCKCWKHTYHMCN